MLGASREREPSLELTMINLLAFLGRAADRNGRAMVGAAEMGRALGAHMSVTPRIIGRAEEPLGAKLDIELTAARATLRPLANAVAETLANDLGPIVIAMGRCAGGLATLPLVAQRFPDARILYFDAHGDCQTPETSTTGYLGGMVLTGAAGIWDSGLGGGLDLAKVMLVGARDLDPPEKERIELGEIALTPIAPGMAARIRAWIDGAPVYVHFDCDVLDAGLSPSEFQVPDGLQFDGVTSIAAMLARENVIGAEIAEYEATWPDGRSATPAPIIDALGPLLLSFKHRPALGNALSPKSERG